MGVLLLTLFVYARGLRTGASRATLARPSPASRASRTTPALHLGFTHVLDPYRGYTRALSAPFLGQLLPQLDFRATTSSTTLASVCTSGTSS